MSSNARQIDFVPKGAIFDMDDTLLNNYPADRDMSLHEQARWMAVREAGERHGIAALANLSAELNDHVLDRAPDHSIYGATWQIFYELGVVLDRHVDRENELLKEVVKRKDELYLPLLAEFGAPVERAVEFVQAMYVLTDGRLAIATGAPRHIIEQFLHTTGLHEYFAGKRIFGQGDYSHFKPHAEPFDLAFRSLGLAESDRARVIAFEDDPKGIISAKTAGLYTAAIMTRFDEDTLLATEPAPDMVAPGFVDYAEALGIQL